jgi:hypothetical protein
VQLWKLTRTKTHKAFLFAKPSPLNINLSSDRFSMFNKERDIFSRRSPPLQAAPTRLITRLILEHADKSRIASMAEAGHDH